MEMSSKYNKELIVICGTKFIENDKLDDNKNNML